MTEVLAYDAARTALQRARDVDEVKDIADRAEALRHYARQARDVELEVWTAEIRLRAMRRLGELSRELEKAPRVQNLSRRRGAATSEGKRAALEAAGVSKDVAHRCERLAAMPEEEVERRVAGARARKKAITVAEFLVDAVTDAPDAPHVARRSGNDEWRTPPRYLEAAREVLGSIDLDPASSAAANADVRAATFYDEEADGLSLPWRGRVWLNPPYSTGRVEAFVARLVELYAEDDVEAAIVLVNNATDTRWFQALLGSASAFCFHAGRIRFVAADGSIPEQGPLQGQVFAYLGPEPGKFCDAFRGFGRCLIASEVE